MGPAVVVLVHVGRDEPAQLTEARVLAEVEAVVLQVSEPALYEDVATQRALPSMLWATPWRARHSTYSSVV